MRIIDDVKLDFQDVLLVPKRSSIQSRKDVDLEREFRFKYSPLEWHGVPIISANMDSVTTPEVVGVMADNSMLAALPKAYNFAKGYFSNNFVTQGIIEERGLLRTQAVICDVANGYMETFIYLVEETRDRYPDCIIVAGNVVSPEAVEALIFAGADIVKVGIGSGSACLTRLKTGVGYPQLSAVIECADAAHGLGGHIISDGGCTTPADICKAFAAGADIVMLGGMLGGHQENGSEFYGMSSRKANEIHNGGLQNYKAAEGLEVKIPNRGPLQNTLDDIKGSLRSCCAYVGAINIKSLPKCATFVKVGRQLNQSLWDYRENN